MPRIRHHYSAMPPLRVTLSADRLQATGNNPCKRLICAVASLSRQLVRVSSGSARIGGDEALTRRTSYQWIMQRSGIPLFHRDVYGDLLVRVPRVQRTPPCLRQHCVYDCCVSLFSSSPRGSPSCGCCMNLLFLDKGERMYS